MSKKSFSRNLLSSEFQKWFVINFLYPKRFPKSKILSYLPRKMIGEEIIVEKEVSFGNHLNAIGDYTWIGEGTHVDRCDSIGKLCSIGRGTAIGLSNHPLEQFTTSGWGYRASRGIVKDDYVEVRKPSVIIGNDVLLSYRSIILEGCVVQNGTVIGANSVLTKSTKPYGIYAGCPAKLIRYRFNNDVIKKLEKVDWDNLDRCKLSKFYASFEEGGEFSQSIPLLY